MAACPTALIARHNDNARSCRDLCADGWEARNRTAGKKPSMQAEGSTWNRAASADEKADLLYRMVTKQNEKLGQARQEIRQARQEAQDGDAALRTIIEGHVGGLRETARQIRARQDERDRQAARVDARGLLPIALSIILTGLPSDLAKVSWLGWTLILAAPAITFCIALRVAVDAASPYGDSPQTR